MTHARILDFSKPLPVYDPVKRRAARAIALGLHPQALEPPSEPARMAGPMRTPCDFSELLAAAVIIVGGIFLTGLASLQ